MEDDVPAKVKKARTRKLHAVQRAITRKKTKALIGREVDVLVEGVSDESDFLLEGRWWGQAPEIDGKVYLANGTAERSEIRKAFQVVSQSAAAVSAGAWAGGFGN